LQVPRDSYSCDVFRLLHRELPWWLCVRHRRCVVLSGGVALGSYQGGAFEGLQAQAGLTVGWVAGSSVGALNCAMIAGCSPAKRLDALRSYWLRGSVWNVPTGMASPGGMRHAANWMSVVQARLFGSPRHVQAAGPQLTFSSFYDLTPTVEYLRTVVDFGRLNSGELRITVAATDLETGDLALFDSQRDRIGMDHLLASCGFLPEFAPVEIDGRLLGDGGLAANAPIEPVLDESEASDATIFVVDVFARDGARPRGLEAALQRKNSLMFGNQTFLRLDAYRRLWKSQERTEPLTTVLYLSCRPVEGEAGPEMAFDFSQASANDRWRAGRLDMEEALLRHDAAKGEGAVVTAIRRRQRGDGSDRERKRPPTARRWWPASGEDLRRGKAAPRYSDCCSGLELSSRHILCATECACALAPFFS
jgi:NTE family protein